MNKLLAVCFVPVAVIAGTARPAPGQGWRQYATPEEAGFSSEALDRARHIGDSVLSGGVFVVYRGHVLAAWGDVGRKLELHSVRKSLTSALYGIAIAEGRISLDQTLRQLGIDDTTRLTEAEKGAAVRQVIAARSGVYLPAAYAPADQDSTRPTRGQFAPGTNWFYNNWDFNVAELIYERRSGTSIYSAFAEKIATPIGMEDFQPSDGFIAYEPSASTIGAHTWRMSARDLARFGLLFLQKGQWNGRQVVPAEWIRESTSPHSDLGGGRGYGYMWWTYDRNSYGDRVRTLNRFTSYAASGSGGQAIVVVPEADLVVVHRGDTDNNRGVAGGRVWGLVDLVLSARTGEPKPNPRLVPLAPTPFASQLPPLARPPILSMRSGEVAALLGEYDGGLPARIRVTEFLGKPFVFMPGRGDAELLRIGDWRYTIAVVPGVIITAERDASGRVTGLVAQIGPQRINARRVAVPRSD